MIDAMAQVLAGLDPLPQRICPMEHVGAFGAASDLIHIAFAAELAGQASVLALMTSAEQGAVVVVGPGSDPVPREFPYVPLA